MGTSIREMSPAARPSAGDRDVLARVEGFPVPDGAVGPVDADLGPAGGTEPEVGGTELPPGVAASHHHLPFDPVTADAQLDPCPDGVTVGTLLGEAHPQPVADFPGLLPDLGR